MRQYLQLLKDFLAAFKAGNYWEAWDILILLQKAARELFGPSAVIMALAAGEKEEYLTLVAEAETALNAKANEVTASKDGKIIAWLIKIGLAVIGIPLPFEAE